MFRVGGGGSVPYPRGSGSVGLVTGPEHITPKASDPKAPQPFKTEALKPKP